MLATFNEQMERLFDLLRVVEDIRLSPEVLEPDPVDIAGTVGSAGQKYICSMQINPPFYPD
mgnify:FL=1